MVTFRSVTFYLYVTFLTYFLSVKVESVSGEEFQDLVLLVREQSSVIQRLEVEVKDLKHENDRQSFLIDRLIQDKPVSIKSSDGLQVQNITIEERVVILELQVGEIQDDITTLEQNDNFLFDEQVIQDERLLNLEVQSDETVDELEEIDNSVQSLQDTTLALDFRVKVLGENGGDSGNSSVAELEVRVETLEGTAADHETRISEVQADVQDLEESVTDQSTRLIVAEENIQELQMTDVELDARVTTLEENSGDSENETIAFMVSSPSEVPINTAVKFNEVLINQGDGYNITTGTFTVPPGGDEHYFFSIYLLIDEGLYGYFDIRIYALELLCTAATEQQELPIDDGQAGCNGVAYAKEGDIVQTVYRDGPETFPLSTTGQYNYNGFSGFRI